MIKYLFVMPDDYVISANMDSELSPTFDQKCKLYIRDFKETFETGKAQGGVKKKWEQTWYLGFWILRIVSKGTCRIQALDNDSDSDLEDGFAGMKI